MRTGESEDIRFCKYCGSTMLAEKDENGVARYECGRPVKPIIVDVPSKVCIEVLKNDIRFWKSLLMDGVENPYKDMA